MARMDSVNNEDLRRYLLGHSHFYNLDSSVGWGCPNKRDDVLLVQFFLNIISEVLVDDGIFGPKTWKEIKWRQGKGGDGVVSVADGTKLMGTKSRAAYFIYTLNHYYLTKRGLYFLELTMDPRLHMDLVSRLR